VKIQFGALPRQTEIQRPADWDRLPLFARPLRADAEGGRGLVRAAKSEAPVLLTLYSPYMLINNMVGPDTATRLMQENSEAYRVAMGRMTESLVSFVRVCIRAGLDGFYHSTQGGEPHGCPTHACSTSASAYDLTIMEEINAVPFNILHVCDYHAPMMI
jgi:uroporphyrinogen-III decarboxylase